MSLRKRRKLIAFVDTRSKVKVKDLVIDTFTLTKLWLIMSFMEVHKPVNVKLFEGHMKMLKCKMVSIDFDIDMMTFLDDISFMLFIGHML